MIKSVVKEPFRSRIWIEVLIALKKLDIYCRFPKIALYVK
jgi:hypothetical protein